MRVIECDVCGQALSAANDEELVEIARRHMEERHSGAAFDAARVREQAYDATDS
jgi:predicted small metal-binding protein